MWSVTAALCPGECEVLEVPMEEVGVVASGAGAPGAWGLTGLISQPQLLEQGLAGVAARWHRWEGLLLYSVFVSSPLGNRPKMAKKQPKAPKKYQKSPKNGQKLPTCQPFLPHQQ